MEAKQPFLKDIGLHKRADGRLGAIVVGNDGAPRETVVHVGRCFPWSRPNKYVSVRDQEGRELVLIEDLKMVKDRSVRALLMEELRQRTFVPEIRAISAIDDEIELFCWHVETDIGRRTFYTRRRDIPRSLPNGGTILKDISGDRYLIPDVNKLDLRSRNLLWLYLD